MAKIERSKVLQDLLGNLEMICEELKIDRCVKTTVSSESFCREEFWKKIVDSGKCVSHEATKLSLVFSRPPLPEAASLEPICRSTEMACLALVSTLCKFPEKQGTVIRKCLRADVSAIIRSLCCLLNELLDFERKGIGQLQITGSIWENCQKLENALTNNKSAVLQQISSFNSLIKDAQQELDEAIRDNLNKVSDEDEDEDVDDVDDAEENFEDDDFQSKWSSDELEIAKASLGLLKTAQTCSKKAHETVSSNGKSDELQEELDDIAGCVEASSNAVDDFVSSLYQPMNKLEAMKKADALAFHLQSILAGIRKSHCYTDADAAWWGFLWKAIEHNLNKVENLTGKRLG